MIGRGNARQAVAVAEKGRAPDATRAVTSAVSSGPTSTQALLALQRTIGNTAVIQVLRRTGQPHERPQRERPQLQRCTGHGGLAPGLG